jgi:hypothetical protein
MAFSKVGKPLEREERERETEKVCRMHVQMNESLTKSLETI